MTAVWVWIGDGELENIRTKICLMMGMIGLTFLVLGVKVNLWWEGWD